MFVLEFLASWLIADAYTGLIHWYMDRHMEPKGIFKGTVSDNEEHHGEPTAMLRFTLLQNAETAPIAVIIAGVLASFGLPMLVWLPVLFLSTANVVHRWTHERRNKVPRLVKILQKIGIFQSPSHHSGHHRKGGRFLTRLESRERYCILTNYLNPILDFVFGSK